MLFSAKYILDEGLYFLILLSISIISSCIFTLIIKKQNKNWIIPLIKTLFLPGIIVHELSHFIICKIFSVRISKVVFFSSETISGSIKPINLDEKSPLQLFYIVFSPTFIGIGLIYYISPYIASLTLDVLPSLLLLYFLISVLFTLHISFEDLTVFFQSFKSSKQWVLRDVIIVVISCIMTIFLMDYISSLYFLFFMTILFQYIMFLLYNTIIKLKSERHLKMKFSIKSLADSPNNYEPVKNQILDLLDSNL